MLKRANTLGLVLATAAGVLVLAGPALAGEGAAAKKDAPKTEAAKKHKVVFHFNEADAKKAGVVLTNIQNFVDVVGWESVEGLELVTHGPGLQPFLKETMDPDVKGKLDKLMAGGLKVGVCGITMKRQQIKPESIPEGATQVTSGQVRLVELQEAGYVYIKP